MNVLVVNAGSSSLKYQLLDTDTREVFAKGNCERIGSDMGIFGHSENGGAKQTEEVPFPDHRSAIARVLEELEKTDFTIDGIGHRIVQGGWYFGDSSLVDEDVLAKIREVAPLAPLHNNPEANVIEYCLEQYPDLPNVTVYDTAFHLRLLWIFSRSASRSISLTFLARLVTIPVATQMVIITRNVSGKPVSVKLICQKG